MYNKKIAVIWLSLVMLFSLIVIIVEIAPRVEAPTTWYVDDSNPGPGDGLPGNPFKTIQAGVDNATPGDTVYVYNGTYYEDVEITKTINLIGESRDDTLVNGSPTGGAIWGHNADYINITNFTVTTAVGSGTGIGLTYSNYSLIKNVKAIDNNYGIIISNCNGSIVKDNIAMNNSDYHGIYLSTSTHITVENNICTNNNDAGIYLYDGSSYNKIIGNNLSMNYVGINIAHGSDNNLIINNTVSFNTGSFIGENGLSLYSSNNNIVQNLTAINNEWGVVLSSGSVSTSVNYITNSTIKNSDEYDVVIGFRTQGTFLNTTFNKNKVYFSDITDYRSWLKVKWYLHINVIDYFGNPVPNVKVKIEDNKNGTYNETFTTDGNGYLRWMPIIEYIEQNLDGDNIGEKTFYTPHKIVAWNDTLVGYAQPFIDESKTVTIVLYNGTLMDLELGWNLVSLSRIQSDTNLQTVLQSIEGQYDAVQWYNITDNNDPWKHHHISKPSNLNDLEQINHTMGLWVHVTDPGGTTLVVFGDVLTSTQNITLYPEWNLVGYPSTTDKTRTAALNNVFFDTEVDAIWTYNATTQKWKEITASDNFEIGRGYWIHSKVTKTWIVPL